MTSTVKQGNTKAVVGDVVTMGAGDTLYEASQSQSAQLIGHHAGCELAGVEAQEWSEALPEITVGKPCDVQPEDDQCLQEHLRAMIAKAQSGHVDRLRRQVVEASGRRLRRRCSHG